MADFAQAFPLISAHEGGYSNDIVDAGGETYAGISRKNFPAWSGWSKVDESKPLNHNQFVTGISADIESFYKTEFWNKMMGDRFDSQRVASFVFDWFVNSGRQAIKTLQNLVAVPSDGIMGDDTIAAVNQHEPVELMNYLMSARIHFYRTIVANNPSQEKFLNGWLSRVNSFA